MKSERTREMNKVLVTGNLARDPEKMRTENGIVIVNDTIAVNRQFKDKNGERGVDFIQFTAFNQPADYLAKYARKGDKVEIVGRWQNRQYTEKDTNKVRTISEIIVEQCSLLTSKKEKEEQEPAKAEEKQEPILDDDLPF